MSVLGTAFLPFAATTNIHLKKVRNNIVHVSLRIAVVGQIDLTFSTHRSYNVEVYTAFCGWSVLLLRGAAPVIIPQSTQGCPSLCKYRPLLEEHGLVAAEVTIARSYRRTRTTLWIDDGLDSWTARLLAVVCRSSVDEQ
jgi:hypothetical protein